MTVSRCPNNLGSSQDQVNVVKIIRNSTKISLVGFEPTSLINIEEIEINHSATEDLLSYWQIRLHMIRYSTLNIYILRMWATVGRKSSLFSIMPSYLREIAIKLSSNNISILRKQLPHR